MWGHLKISKTCDGNSKITVLDSWLHVSRKKPVKRSTFSRTGSAVVFFDRGGSLVTSPGVLHLFIYTHQMYSWKRTGKGKGRITRMSSRGIPDQCWREGYRIQRRRGKMVLATNTNMQKMQNTKMQKRRRQKMGWTKIEQIQSFKNTI